MQLNQDPGSKYSAHLPFVILIISSVLAGILIFQDFGESWDFKDHLDLGKFSLSFYRFGGIETDENIQFNIPAQLNYGPVHDEFSQIGIQLIQSLTNKYDVYDLKKLFNYLSFQIGVIGFYFICTRLFSNPTSLLVTTLFLTQPLLFGHAFINPKDIPFMSYFILAMAAGFYMVDSLLQYGTIEQINQRVTRQRKKHPSQYLKSRRSVFWFNLLDRVESVRIAAKEFSYYVVTPRVLLAGVALGLAASIRALGPFAGFLIIVLMLIKLGRRALMPAAAYLFIAFFVTDLSSPYLWENPFRNYIASLFTMVDYPWLFEVLFNGNYYLATDLPMSYLPVLLGIQLTETMLILFLGGLSMLIIRGVKMRYIMAEWIIICSWFFVVFIYVLATRPNLYDNTRQLFFILPPIFIIAGQGIQWMMNKLKRGAFRYGFFCLVLLPGIVGIIKYHPYQYVYYNSLVGGAQGAARQYELDYWGASYERLTGELNRIASSGAKVLVTGPSHIVGRNVREDLLIVEFEEPIPSSQEFDYLISTTRWDLDQRLYPEARIVYQVDIDGAMLAVLKELH